MNPKPIFLVEDSVDDATLIKRSLKKSNVLNHIVEARDGAQALELLFAETGQRLEPAVILLDLKLPKVDGLEVLEKIRADDRTKRIPVVILTSSDDQEDIIRSYDLGASSYVRKPVGFAEFSETASHLGLYWVMVNEPPPE